MIQFQKMCMWIGAVSLIMYGGVGLYFALAFIAELVISTETRIAKALRLQPAIGKYLRNRKKIDALLKEQTK